MNIIVYVTLVTSLCFSQHSNAATVERSSGELSIAESTVSEDIATKGIPVGQKDKIALQAKDVLREKRAQRKKRLDEYELKKQEIAEKLRQEKMKHEQWKARKVSKAARGSYVAFL